MTATLNDGSENTARNAVTSCVHTNKVIRFRLMPGARNWMMVTMKLIDPMVVASPSSRMPRAQKSMPCVLE
jgi:hypothetical protein